MQSPVEFATVLAAVSGQGTFPDKSSGQSTIKQNDRNKLEKAMESNIVPSTIKPNLFIYPIL